MKSFFRRLVNAGITPQLTSQQIRTLTFLNTVTLLVTILISFNAVFTAIMMPLSAAGTALLVASATHALLIALIIPLNFRRQHLAARIWFGCVAGSFMCIYAIVMGSETRWTFFSPIIIFILFYMFPANEKKWMFAVITYCTLGFIACELWSINHQALYDFPPAIVSSFKYINTVGFLFCAIGMGMVGYNAMNAAEKKLAEEHSRSENLLLNILPAPIASRLKTDPGIIADGYDNVTILFADIADFTKLSSTISPGALIQLLNDIFSKFDELADHFGLEKIKTIGDAYMVVAGIPQKRRDHAESMAQMATAMLTAMMDFNKSHEHKLNLRIGICSGPVVAGVIGKRKFSYDLWGDSVNTASRMESHGIAGEIQVAESTYELLQGKYNFDCRGTIEVKGKGMMKTYLLKGSKT